MHTRYAPVRRSPAEYCYSLLPLDLHVLSLPLAFILSQDQTLHCKNCSFYLLDSSSHLPPCLNRMVDTRYLFLLIRFYELSFSCRKRVQKYNLFPNRQNIFSKKIHPSLQHVVNQRRLGRKNFAPRPFSAPQTAPRRQKNHKNRTPRTAKTGQKTPIYTQIATKQSLT